MIKTIRNSKKKITSGLKALADFYRFFGQNQVDIKGKYFFPYTNYFLNTNKV